MRSKEPALRVLFVSHTAELNGSETMLLGLLRGLDRKTFAPVLVVPRPGPLVVEASRAGIPFRVVPFKWWLTPRGRVWKQPFAWLLNIPSVARLRRLIRVEKAGLVVTNSAACFSGALAARWAGVPHVWIIHEILRGRESLLSFVLGWRALVGLISRLSRVVVVNSRATGEAFSSRDRVNLIPNGLDVRRAAGRPDAKLRRRLGFASKDKVLGIVGKVTSDKRQREAILALSELAPSHPEARLLVVGATTDRRYVRDLEALVKERGLAGRVVFSGYVPDVFAHLRLMDLLLIASRTESFGRTAIEAMAAGVPVLAVAVGGLPEIITPGKDGFLVESSAPGILAAEVDWLLGHPALLRRAASGGPRTVRARFDLGRVTREFERVLRSAAGPGGRRA